MPNVSVLPPAGRPQLSEGEFQSLLHPYGIDLGKYPLVVCGMRGFFAETMGATLGNERDIYDDALFLWAPQIDLYRAFNGNTDPSKLRVGFGTGASKGAASLNPGVWFSYRFADHTGSKTSYPAICQRASTVTVTRDGNTPYADTGWFGINIHRGGNYSTSSEGCQTIPPIQWTEFIDEAHEAGHTLFKGDFANRVIPYVLVDRATLADAAPSAPKTLREQADTFRQAVIRPTLARLGLWSEAAEELLLGTALTESKLKDRTQMGGGPARGLFQMEPGTHDDIWTNFLKFRQPLAIAVESFSSTPGRHDSADLERNDAYACAMARVHYLRVPVPLPPAGDVERMANYWKMRYNTAGGGGSIQSYLSSWKAVFG